MVNQEFKEAYPIRFSCTCLRYGLCHNMVSIAMHVHVRDHNNLYEFIRLTFLQCFLLLLGLLLQSLVD